MSDQPSEYDKYTLAQEQMEAVVNLSREIENLAKVNAAAAIVHAEVLRENSEPSTTPRKQMFPKDVIEDACQILDDNIDNQ